MVNLNNVGTTIKMLRESKGLKQKDLQQNLLNSCNLSKIERNVSQVSIATFFEILELLNVTIDEFFILHSLNIETKVSDYHKISAHLNHSFHRISKEHLEEYKNRLSLHNQTSFKDLVSNKEKILFHRLACFYYLNFQKDREKASIHAAVLLDYYKNIIQRPLLAELEILPLLMPFLTISEGKHFLEDFQFFHKIHPHNYHVIQKIFIRAQLNFAKRCLETKNSFYFAETIESLAFELLNYPIPSFYCEHLILKGILFYEFEKQKEAGKALIAKGLKLAKDFHFFNIYNNWEAYCNIYIT